jgi:hypothetical protein
MKPKYEWCDGPRKFIGQGRSEYDRFGWGEPGRYRSAPRVRCPKCNRMLTAQTINDEDWFPSFTPTWYIPPHKRRLPRPRVKCT